MIVYYYRTSISKSGIGYPESNADHLADFTNNRMALATKVTTIEVIETTLIIDKTYEQFSAIVPAWSDVNYYEVGDAIELALLSGSLL